MSGQNGLSLLISLVRLANGFGSLWNVLFQAFHALGHLGMISFQSQVGVKLINYLNTL